MLNQIVLVGRLVGKVEVEKVENTTNASLVLAVPRSFKNVDGVYDTDFINVKLFGNVATNTQEYCKKGDLIGIRGSVQSRTEEKEDGSKVYKIEVIAERVTFLSDSSRRNEE